MRSVKVQFPSGREVLRSYWGFLHHGGLALVDPADLVEGDAIELDMHIRSLKQRYHFKAKVVRRAADKTFVSFDAGQAQEVMINAAWADSQEVPQRKHRRYPTQSEVSYSGPDGEHPALGQMLDLSRGGCRVKGTRPLPVGSRVRLEAEGCEMQGKIRWTTPACEMGIEFTTVHDDLPLAV